MATASGVLLAVLCCALPRGRRKLRLATPRAPHMPAHNRPQRGPRRRRTRAAKMAATCTHLSRPFALAPHRAPRMPLIPHNEQATRYHPSLPKEVGQNALGCPAVLFRATVEDALPLYVCSECARRMQRSHMVPSPLHMREALPQLLHLWAGLEPDARIPRNGNSLCNPRSSWHTAAGTAAGTQLRARRCHHGRGRVRTHTDI